MTLRSILFLFVLVSLIAETQGATNRGADKIFEEKIDSLISKRMELPLVSSKLDVPGSRFVPVYGNVIEAGGAASRDFLDDGENLFDAESLYNAVNEHLMLRNEALLKKASADVRNKYGQLSSRFNFINLERVRIRVDYYYDRVGKTWVRPTHDSIVTMTMIVKSGYFLYQDSDSLIDIRRYGYYIPNSKVKRIFFGDGYSEVLWDNPNEAPLDSVKVLPYKLVERILLNKENDERNRKKIRNLLKNREFASIPRVIQEMDEYCEENQCDEMPDYRRYLNVLAALYKTGVLRRF